MKTTRLAPNPLAAQLEERHCDMLDELHRLLQTVDPHGCCVCGPVGVTGEPMRRATDEESRYAEISISTQLFFDVSGTKPDVEASKQISELIEKLRSVSYLITSFGEKQRGMPFKARLAAHRARRNGKR